MTVRDRTGRKRYIAFEIVSDGGSLSRGKLAKAIDERTGELGMKCRPEVILISNGKGIVRANHRDLEEVLSILNSFSDDARDFKLKTIRTSGTIRTLKEAFFPAASCNQ